MSKVRWGILSTAKINDQMIPAMHEADNAELVGVASRDLEKAQSYALDRNIPKAFGSYQELLDDPDIDVVYVPLPNTLHEEWTRRIAEAGKHVLCEKPLCPTADEAQSLIDFCDSKGVKLLDNFMWPHHPRTALLRQILDRGDIGDVQHVVGNFSFPMNPLDQSNIRLQKDLAGGALLDIGIYPVYGIRWAMGAEPVKVHAQAKFLHDVDVEMSAILYFADDRSATFDCAFTWPYRGALEITGTQGTLSMPKMWQPRDSANWIITTIDGESEEHVIEGENHRVHLVQNFSRAILDNEPASPEMAEAVKTLRVLDALAKSAREGVTVTLCSQ